MINLSIKISDSETKTIQLTDTKPLVQTAVAIFWEGVVYYAPVVDKGAWLDSGIRVRDPTKIPAVRGIASKPFDPLLYDACNNVEGRATNYWGYSFAGAPFMVKPGSAAFFGAQFLQNNGNNFTVSEQNFFLAADFTPKKLAGAWQDVVEISKDSNSRIYLGISPENKICLYLNTTRALTYATALQINEEYNVQVKQEDGIWSMNVDGNDVGTKSVSMALGSYSFSIGNSLVQTAQYFHGLIHYVAFGKYSNELWSKVPFGKGG